MTTTTQTILRLLRRILIGALFGLSAGALVGPVTGIAAGLIIGDQTIFLIGPLEVDTSVVSVVLGFSMLFFGVLCGMLIGVITAAINRPGTGWLIGMLAGSAVGSVLFRSALLAAAGAVTGLVAGLAAQNRLAKELPPGPGGEGPLQAADAYTPRALRLRLILCLAPAVLGAFLLIVLDSIVGIIVLVPFALGAIYFGYLLRLKRA